MESMQSIVWNPLQDGMESSRRKCTFGDAMRLWRYHTRLRVIPYQACGLNKKFDKSKLVEFFGRGRRTRTHDPWFWRPVLYQLSYTPMLQILQHYDYIKKLSVCQALFGNIFRFVCCFKNLWFFGCGARSFMNTTQKSLLNIIIPLTCYTQYATIFDSKRQNFFKGEHLWVLSKNFSASAGISASLRALGPGNTFSSFP